ncbi:hypothetical protein WA026_001448 [Henosepilachna vigintioctopunctata]|uniref:Transcription factor CBF/NF-Y/archaeal histone domain-containing protein n=1 Tax=Henosepilachna vigintioctopunctata TaxID=420089 RepID=A0AAW1URW0_9CUCU
MNKRSGFKMATKPVLPLNRVCTIMKSSSDVDNVGKDSTCLMAKATELFIKKLVVDGYKKMKLEKSTSKFLHYQSLADIVQMDEKYEFLRDMMPKKITVREYKKIMSRKRGDESGINTEDSSDNSGSDSEDSTSSTSRSSRSANSVITLDSD